MLPDIAHIPYSERDANYHYDPPAPVPIFQHQFEWQVLLDIYRAKRPMRVLEIGTYHGGTLYHLLRNAQPGAVVVAVDIYNTGPDTDNRNKYPDWTPEDVTLHVIVGDSRKPSIVRRVAAHGPFDFIWIDADHYEASVQADWDNYSKLAAPGSIIALHDIVTHASWPSIEVEKVWRRIQRQGYVTQEIYWSTGIPPNDQGWGGIGVVKMP